jgi:hypothetical protein
MSRGSAIMGPAAVVAFVCFFLPWVTSSCQGQDVATLSGRELAAGTTVELRPAPGAPAVQTQRVKPQRSLYAIPLVAAVCLLLVTLVYLRVMRPPLAGLISAVLAIICLLILLNRTVEIRRQADDNGFDVKARYGAIGAALAYVAMLLGGIVDIFTGWTPRAVARAGPVPRPEAPQ